MLRTGVLRTERLLLRPWRDDDREPFAAMGADPIVMEHFPSLLSRDASDAVADRIRGNIERDGHGFWAVELPGIAPFIGFAGISRPSWLAVVEVGWRFAPAFWNRGYATEAARASVAWGFTHLGLNEIVAFVRPANVRSQHVMERLGMVRDPGADFDHPNIIEPAMRPHWLYRLQRAAWSENRQHLVAKVEPLKS